MCQLFVTALNLCDCHLSVSTAQIPPNYIFCLSLLSSTLSPLFDISRGNHVAFGGILPVGTTASPPPPLLHRRHCYSTLRL